MSDSFTQGDRVQWQSPQGTVYGTVRKKLTQPTEIKGHHVATFEDIPEYLVENEKIGAGGAQNRSAEEGMTPLLLAGAISRSIKNRHD